ncbi:MAG: hypothetical protein IPP72_08725 [Chitinophagaceae bacterium]|nr:hypothetical protein [Chitinophagaceae bacterium]
MSYLIFFLWLIVLSWSLTKIRFIKNAGLGNKIIIGLFICKVASGMAGGWIAHLTRGTDTWNYHNEGLTEYHLLFLNPKEYFTNLFYTGYSYAYEGVLQTQNSYWNDLKTNLIIKLLSVFDIFSGGNYYVNVILYNFLIFFGHIGLYRIFKAVYKADTWLVVMLVFLLPSLLFYSSTIHKDGLMLATIGVIVFNVYYALHFTGFVFKRILFITVSLLLLFFFRNFILFAILPALAAVILTYKTSYSPVKVFATVYLFSAIVFFNLHRVVPSVNLPLYMAQKQSDFLGLEKGNTTIALKNLEPNVVSYLKNAPQAFQHSLCRPFITDISLSKLLLPLCFELLFYELLILVFLFFQKSKPLLNNPFVLFGLFFGLSVCLVIGYTVPVIGAIVRYRSIYLPFLLGPFVLNTDWDAVKNIFKLKK